MQGQPNPFPVRNPDGSVRGWDWCDEAGFPSGRLYPTQRDATRDLLRYVRELERGPSLLQRVRSFVSQMVRVAR